SASNSRARTSSWEISAPSRTRIIAPTTSLTFRIAATRSLLARIRTAHVAKHHGRMSRGGPSQPRTGSGEIAHEDNGKRDYDSSDPKKENVSDIMPSHALPFGDVSHNRWGLAWSCFEMVA